MLDATHADLSHTEAGVQRWQQWQAESPVFSDLSFAYRLREYIEISDAVYAVIVLSTSLPCDFLLRSCLWWAGGRAFLCLG